MSFKVYSNRKEKLLKTACVFVTCLILLTLSLLAYQVLNRSRTVKITNQPQAEKSTERKQENRKAGILSGLMPEKDRLLGKNKLQDKQEINILILGTKGEDYGGQNLTDTLILLHLKPQAKKAIMVSLPRDLLVNPPNRNYRTKINSVYASSGIDSLKEVVKNITGFRPDHHLVVDLTVVRNIIDSVDGLNVYVPKNIDDPYFPTTNHGYKTFKMKAGWRYMDGETALRYVRSRYTSPNGDFDRMARQQQIINLLKQKVLALNPLGDFPTYLKIFKNLSDHIITDLNVWQLKDLWQIAKDIPLEEIKNIVVDKKETKLLRGDMVKLGKYKASVVYPKAGQGNYEEVKQYIREQLRK